MMMKRMEFKDEFTKEILKGGNQLIIGSAGTGKTYKFVREKILNKTGSYVVIDRNGWLMNDTAEDMKNSGYKVKCINFMNTEGMRSSTKIDVFRYLRTEVDVAVLVKQIIDKFPLKVSGYDSFFESLNITFLSAICSYVYEKGVLMPNGKVQHNIPAIMELLKKAKVKIDASENREDSELDVLMKELEKQEPDSRAVINYKRVMIGNAATVHEVIEEVKERLKILDNKELLSVLSENEIEFESFGCEKTILYMVIPDNDSSFNGLVSFLCEQIMRELFYQAESQEDGKLPIPVTWLWEEMGSISVPEANLLTCIRSRNMRFVGTVQSTFLLKKKYGSDWEQLLGMAHILVCTGARDRITQDDMCALLKNEKIKKCFLKMHNKNCLVSVVGEETLIAKKDEVAQLLI